MVVFVIVVDSYVATLIAYRFAIACLLNNSQLPLLFSQSLFLPASQIRWHVPKIQPRCVQVALLSMLHLRGLRGMLRSIFNHPLRKWTFK